MASPSVSHKRQLGKAFRSSSGILPGVNGGAIDLKFLRSTPLIETNIDREGIDRVFDKAVARDGWLIFYSHDVRAAPSPLAGCSPTMLRHALEAASPENPDPERHASAKAGGQRKRFSLRQPNK